jgi:hypothetical protein
MFVIFWLDHHAFVSPYKAWVILSQEKFTATTDAVICFLRFKWEVIISISAVVFYGDILIEYIVHYRCVGVDRKVIEGVYKMDKKVKEQASEVDRRVGDKLKSVWESSSHNWKRWNFQKLTNKSVVWNRNYTKAS